MEINPTRPFIRIASLLARLYQEQISRDNEATLRRQFAALDHGLPPTTTSVFGPGLPITVLPNPGDPLERLWHLPASWRRSSPRAAGEIEAPNNNPTEAR
jgi:hypothetical protein